MKEENKCTALAVIEKGELEPVEQSHAQKKREVIEALKQGKIADPVTILVAVGVSIVSSLVGGLAQRLFAPQPPPVTRGALSGQIQIMNSEQGLFIPEIYGAEPE